MREMSRGAQRPEERQNGQAQRKRELGGIETGRERERERQRETERDRERET